MAHLDKQHHHNKQNHHKLHHGHTQNHHKLHHGHTSDAHHGPSSPSNHEPTAVHQARDVTGIRALNAMMRKSLQKKKQEGEAWSFRTIAKGYTHKAKKLNAANFVINSLEALRAEKQRRNAERLTKIADELEAFSGVSAATANRGIGNDFKGFVDTLHTMRNSLLEVQHEMEEGMGKEELVRQSVLVQAYHDLSARILATTWELKQLVATDAVNTIEALKLIKRSETLSQQAIEHAGDGLEHVKEVVKNAQLSLEQAAREARGAVVRAMTDELVNKETEIGAGSVSLNPAQLRARITIQKAGLPTADQLEEAVNTLQGILPDTCRSSCRYSELLPQDYGRAESKSPQTESSKDGVPKWRYYAPAMRSTVKRIMAGQKGLRFASYLKEEQRRGTNTRHTVSRQEESAQLESEARVTRKTSSAQEGDWDMFPEREDHRSHSYHRVNRLSTLTQIRILRTNAKTPTLWQPGWPSRNAPGIPSDELGPTLLDLFDGSPPPVRLAFHAADSGDPVPCLRPKRGKRRLVQPDIEEVEDTSVLVVPPQLPRPAQDPWEVVDNVFIGGAPEAQVIADTGRGNPWSITAVLNLTEDWFPVTAADHVLPAQGELGYLGDVTYLHLPGGTMDSQIHTSIRYIESWLAAKPRPLRIMLFDFHGNERALAIGLAFASKRCSCQNEVRSMIDEARRNLGGPSEKDALFVIRSLALAFPQ